MISGKLQRLLAATILGVAAVGCAANVDGTKTGTIPAKAGPSVRIEVADGLGSGVAIGNGLVLTAAHVVSTQPDVKVVLDNNRTIGGHVLWVNAEYDLALVRVNQPKALSTAHLSCRVADVGENVSADGNPMGLKFVTMRGYIASKPQEYAPKWKTAYLIDMTTIGGMSGGGLFDRYGDVIGTIVGTLSATGQPYGSVGFVVPGRVACGLLGRV